MSVFYGYLMNHECTASHEPYFAMQFHVVMILIQLLVCGIDCRFIIVNLDLMSHWSVDLLRLRPESRQMWDRAN